MELLFLFLVGHAVADFVLQPEAMGVNKSRRRYQSAQHPEGFPPWGIWLSAHALTHGGAATLACGDWTVGVLETALHAFIDHTKCEGRITFLQDQALHVLCKILYVLFLF